MSTPGCSKKKSEIIISQRPYESWDDLVSYRPMHFCCVLNVGRLKK